MKTLVPYTSIHPATVAGAPEDAEWVDVSGDGYAYHRLLSEWWARGETFTIIEHDVVCRRDVTEAFAECSEPWCAFPYDDMCHWGCMESWANTLGCTRFDASLMEAVPDALSSITDPKLLIWTNVCDGLGNNLRAQGFTHHWHFPAIYHHHMDRPGSRAFASESPKTYPPGALV